MKNRGKGRDLAMQNRPNRARKLGKKTFHDKSIPPPQLLSDSHLPFLHEDFLHGHLNCKNR